MFKALLHAMHMIINDFFFFLYELKSTLIGNRAFKPRRTYLGVTLSRLRPRWGNSRH